MSEKVRVFIGSGEASRLERKTLIHSLRKNSQRDLDIYVFNGTHDAIERNDDPPYRADMPLHIKYRNFTEFSNYRFMIPQLCGYQGRAIFLDSDMVCIDDIGRLFDADMNGCDFLAKAEAYKGGGHWALSVMLIDCAKSRFDLETYFKNMDQGVYGNGDLHEMTPKFLQHHPFKIGALDPQWNIFDQYDEKTKLIHYTNLRTQPWKFPGHPYGDLWFKNFNEARKNGIITSRDIDMTLSRAYARQDILKGNNPPQEAATVSMHAAVEAKPSKLRRKLKKLWGKISGRRAA